jgi:IS5 family transposase
MRQKRDPQRDLQDLKPNWSRARQLAEIDRILDAHPELCDLVADDLAPYRAPQKLPSRAGAKGMTAEQVLRFRAGIEGVISATKRAYGLDRCTWRGGDGFQRYVWSAIVAWNLQGLARHLLG